MKIGKDQQHLQIHSLPSLYKPNFIFIIMEIPLFKCKIISYLCKLVDKAKLTIYNVLFTVYKDKTDNLSQNIEVVD